MSVEKNRREAQRWFETAQGDLASAKILMDNSRYAHSCFHSQQSAEKAMKALWYALDADPWGHSIKNLLRDLKTVDLKTFEKVRHVEKEATVLDRFYITTRYPNGLPDLTPEDAYIEEDAVECLEKARRILDTVGQVLGDRL
jgi:HEPN domain-containing protein